MLKEFQRRDLSKLDIAALFLDGKRFAKDEMVIALGVTLSGEKRLLRFVQTGTENERALSMFLSSLMDQGLRIESGLLVVIDGGKVLRSSVRKVFKGYALVQRYKRHKRENVVSYLSVFANQVTVFCVETTKKFRLAYCPFWLYGITYPSL